jgi:hypothetical protein
MSRELVCTGCGGSGLTADESLCPMCDGWGRIDGGGAHPPDADKKPETLREKSKRWDALARVEAEKMWAAHESKSGKLIFRSQRVFIRCARICGGVVIGAIGLSIMESADYLREMPLSALSLHDLGTLFFSVAVGVLICGGAAWVAFGEYQAPRSATDFVADARREIERRELQEPIDRAARENVDAAYKVSRLWGFLKDPDLGFRGRPLLSALAFLAVIVIVYGIMLVLVALFAQS